MPITSLPPYRSKKQQVIDVVTRLSVVRPRDIAALGLPKEYLHRLEAEGILNRLGRGIYQPAQYVPGCHQTLLETAKRVPGGVIALLSALAFHEFTTQNPFEVWVAVDRKAYKPSLDYPPLRYLSMSGAALAEGVEMHKIDGVTIKVFNPAKTIADCFKYRNKIGIDVAIEALKEGLRTKQIPIGELLHYAEICRVKNVMTPYLESLV